MRSFFVGVFWGRGQRLLGRFSVVHRLFSGVRTSCYTTFSLILENYPTLTRVSASIKRSPARRKKLRFAFVQVGALRHF